MMWTVRNKAVFYQFPLTVEEKSKETGSQIFRGVILELSPGVPRNRRQYGIALSVTDELDILPPLSVPVV